MNKTELIKRLLAVLRAVLRQALLILPRQCSGCHIWTGGIERSLIDYRGHEICSWCQYNWLQKEKRAGRRISFKEYTGVK